MATQLRPILERLLEVLQADTAFTGKIREFRLGELPKEEFGNNFPLCYVTTSTSPFSTGDRTGISVPNSDVQSTIQFEINLVVSRQSKASDVKVDLLNLTDDAINIIWANPRLVNSEGNDPKVVRSTILSVNELARLRGGLIQVATIAVQAQVGSQITLQIPDITETIPVLNIPISREFVNYAPHISTSGGLSGYAATAKANVAYYEIEDTGTIYTQLKTIRDSFQKKTFTVNNGPRSYTVTGYLSAISRGQNYDQIPTLLLQFETL